MTKIIVSVDKDCPYNVEGTELIQCKVFIDGSNVERCVFADEVNGVVRFVPENSKPDSAGFLEEKTQKGAVTITGASEELRVQHMETAKQFFKE